MKKQLMMMYLAALVMVSIDARAGNDTAANWSLQTPDGTTVELAEVAKQKPQIILFWATWCPYCKALMPHLQSVRLEYGDAIGVLAVNIKEDGDPLGYMTDSGFDFTLLLDGDDVADQYNIKGTPGVIIVDEKRKIRFDLRDLPGVTESPDGEKLSRQQRVKRLAPYWGAEIRKALDKL